jgi:biotin-(acetyl-CoA carboxylase) ligase
MLTNKTYKSELEVENLFENIWEYYQLFMQKSHALIDSKYKELLYRLDVLSQFQDSNGVFEGTLIDVDQSGAILILRDGELIRAVHPNVRFYSKT